MNDELIHPDVLIDDSWVSFADQAIADYGSKYTYYIHTTSVPIEIGGGEFGRQIINPLEMMSVEEQFLVSSIERLDDLIDLDFERVWNQAEASSRFFIDSKIDIDAEVLGLTIANSDQTKAWFEIVLDGSLLTDQFYQRYASLHEYGHTLGLEHPFDDGDGDSVGGTNPWTSEIFPEHTVMAYRRPSMGQWPQWFSDSDIRALVEIWGLEDDQSGSYQFSSRSTGTSLMIGDPNTAKQLISDGDFVLDSFKRCDRIAYGSSADDEVYGLTSVEGGWLDEWIFVGSGNDLILGGGGRDQLLGGLGDDILRGGNGQDVLQGGAGNDQLYGGGGLNTLIAGDGQDSLFVLSDQVSHADPSGRNHNGLLADVILGVEPNDRITILGASTSELNVISLEEGIGIQAQGVLEARILQSEMSQSEISAILMGDDTRWF